MHHPTDRITHTTAFVTPVVEHCREQEIAQWVHPMKDRSDDPSHHERTLKLQRKTFIFSFFRLIFQDFETFLHDAEAEVQHLDEEEVKIDRRYSTHDPLSSPLEELRQHRFFEDSIMTASTSVIRQGERLSPISFLVFVGFLDLSYRTVA